MIKVLGFSLYGPLAASTRYRLAQFVPGLAAFGVDLHIVHLLSDDYLRRRFAGLSAPLSTAIQAGLIRFGDLAKQSEYDLVILYCELFPLLPGFIERMLIRMPYIYDFDDAFYLKYRSARMRLVRPLLGDKFDSIVAGAAAVTAGNHVLSRYARQFNANTHHLPTVVDTLRYETRLSLRGGVVFTVGWIGSPSTALYLSELIGPLSAIGLEGPVKFVVIGGKAPIVPNVSVVEICWSEDAEIDLINSFDVGVMPLPNDAWAQGKCAFKLVQYMACGVPVIASPVGANIDVVGDSAGLMATTPGEWVDAFRVLRDEPAKRLLLGQAGRDRVEQHYSLDQNLPKLASIIHQVVRAS